MSEETQAPSMEPTEEEVAAHRAALLGKFNPQLAACVSEGVVLAIAHMLEESGSNCALPPKSFVLVGANELSEAVILDGSQWLEIIPEPNERLRLNNTRSDLSEEESRGLYEHPLFVLGVRMEEEPLTDDALFEDIERETFDDPTDVISYVWDWCTSVGLRSAVTTPAFMVIALTKQLCVVDLTHAPDIQISADGKHLRVIAYLENDATLVLTMYDDALRACLQTLFDKFLKVSKTHLSQAAANDDPQQG